MSEVKSDIDRKVGDAKNISAIQGRIILFLHTESEQGDVNQKDIENHFNIRGSTAAIILRRMEKNGLISRQVDKDDMRKKIVRLTQKAKNLHPAAQAEIERAEKTVTNGLSKKELDCFIKVMDKIVGNIS